MIFSKKKYLIIHHNDRDGIMSAAVIIENLQTKNMVHTADIDLLEVDYATPLKDFEQVKNAKKYKEIYIVDYSISNEINKNAMIDMFKKTKLVWIDHHQSSIDYINKYPELANIIGYRITGAAGCALCYFFINSLFKNTLKNILSKSNTSTPVNPKEVSLALKNLGASQYLIYSHRYDIWDVDNEVYAFNKGFICDKSPFAYTYLLRDSQTIFNITLKNGYIIKKYTDSMNNISVDKYAIKANLIINGVRHKTIIMNTTRCSSTIFGDKFKEYDFAIVFFLRPDMKWQHSIYTAWEFDCKQIAESNGGGGHKQAAGFISDYMFGNLDLEFE